MSEHNATLDVIPELLGSVGVAIPKSVQIVGSEEAQGYVRLRLRVPPSANITGRVRLIVREESAKRVFTIEPSP